MEFKRDKYLAEMINGIDLSSIKVVTGVRRGGKSYLMNTIFRKYLLDSGYDPSQIIYFAFDNDFHLDLLDSYFKSEPTKIVLSENKYVVNAKKFRAYLKDITSENKTYFLLLDEIQLLENFVGTMNGLLGVEKYNVYISGSNSKFLSSDIVTEFRGREYQIHVLPLSFSEFCSGFKVDFGEAYKMYSTFGGIPLTYQYKTESDKHKFLQKLFNETYKKDILDRRKIDKTEEFTTLFSVLASSISSYTNFSKIENIFKSRGVDYSRITIANHVDYMIDSFLLEKCDRYDVKGRKYISTNHKFYFTDIGIRNALLNFRQNEPSHIMENIVYNELLYRGYSVDVGIVEKSVMENGRLIRKQLETDFVCNMVDRRIYVQVCLSIGDHEKYIQESASLRHIKDGFKKIIIVGDDVTKHYTDDGIFIMSIKDFLQGAVLD